MYLLRSGVFGGIALSALVFSSCSLFGIETSSGPAPLEITSAHFSAPLPTSTAIPEPTPVSVSPGNHTPEPLRSSPVLSSGNALLWTPFLQLGIGHPRRLVSSHDGKHFLLTSSLGLQFYESESLTQLRAHDLIPQPCNPDAESYFRGAEAALHPDGQNIAFTGAFDGYHYPVRIWNTAAGTFQPVVIEAHACPRFLAYGMNGSLVILAINNTINLYEPSSGQLTRSLSARNTIDGMAVSPDGKYLAVSMPGQSAESSSTSDSRICEINLWDLSTVQRIRTLQTACGTINTDPEGTSLDFSADSNLLAVGLREKIEIFDIPSGNLLTSFGSGTLSLAFHPVSNNLIAVDGRSGKLVLWDATESRRIQDFSPACEYRDIQFLSKGDLVTAICGGQVFFWETESAQIKETWTENLGWKNFTLHPQGTSLASINLSGSINIWDTASGRLTHNLPGAGMDIAGILFSAQSRIFTYGGHLLEWELTGSYGVEQLERAPLAVSGSGNILAIADDATIAIWDTEHRELLRTIKTGVAVTALALSNNDTYLATTGHNSPVVLWDVHSGLLHCAMEPFDPIQTLAFSADGKSLATADMNFVIRLWRSSDCEPIRSLGNAGDPISGMVFSPDSLLLATRGAGQTIGIWDIVTGSLLRTLNAGPDAVTAIAFTPDNRIFAASGEGGMLRFWEAGESIAVIPPRAAAPLFRRNLFLREPPILGDDVWHTQQRLLQLGYKETGETDGVFNSQTDKAVRRFQEINLLPVTGSVDRSTWDLLFSEDAVMTG